MKIEINLIHHCKSEKIVLWGDMSLLAMNSLYEQKGNELRLARLISLLFMSIRNLFCLR